MQNGIHKYLFIVAGFLLAFTTSSHAELIPQSSWSLLSVDSEETAREDGAASNAFDGDVNTIWHTVYADTPPHTIDIALGNAYQLDGFRYLPRQDGGDNGRIRQYEFYVSSDGANWGSPVASGNFADNASEQEVSFTSSATGAYVRLVALNSYDGDKWTTVAEINLLGSLASGNQRPDGVINTPGSDLTINVGDSLNFTATGSDPDGDLPLAYQWSFGSGSGIANTSSEDPGSKQFNNAGTFSVSFTVTDSQGLADSTPAVRIITVQNPSTSPQLIPQSGWSLLSVDSEETAREDGAASNAFDGDVNTIWHTVYA
ncbi:MAG: hypothetical protein DRQ44_12585, partial [Gammaproteobacteria bacterium]